MVAVHFTRLTAWLCALLLAVPAFAQAPVPSPGQTTAPAKQEPAVLRVTTRLVQVNVIVQDKKGEPATGLTKEDFTLLNLGAADVMNRTKGQAAMPAHKNGVLAARRCRRSHCRQRCFDLPLLRIGER